MKLGISIFDKDNNILNDNTGFLIDEKLFNIKNKVFLSRNSQLEKLKYFPNFCKLLLKNSTDQKTILLNNNDCLLNYLVSPLPENPQIFIYSLLDEIDKFIDIYVFYIKSDNEKLDYYNTLVSEYKDLTFEDFNFLIKNKFYSFLLSENLQIISETEKENIKRDLDYYKENTVNSFYKNNIDEFNEENEYFKNYFRYVYDNKNQLNFNYEINLDNTPSFIFTNISFSIKTNFNKEEKFLNTKTVFNVLELSDEIPFIAYNMTKKDPVIKIYNKLVDSLPKDTIKSWILNENKKKNKITFKKIKGLVFKHRFTFKNASDVHYLTIEFTDNGLINVKTTFDPEDDKRSIDEIMEIIKNIINDIIDKFDKLFGIYSKSKRLSKITKNDINIESINAILTTEELINKDKFPLSDLGVQKFFTAKMINNVEILSFYYTKNCKDYGDDDYERLGLTINIKDNPYKKDSSLLYIFGGSSIVQLETIINHILICNELGKSESEDGLFSDIEEEYEQKIKKKSNIKQIRKYNPSVVNPIKCQKERQPITETSELFDSKKNYEDFRILNYEDTKYICTGDQYKYPGFTPANIICCFQKKGEGFLRNVVDPFLSEMIVQPSNFKINVKIDDKEFQTFAIKLISDMTKDAIDQPFYFLDVEKNELVHIHNKDLVDLIKKNEFIDNETIWLPYTKLYNLIHTTGCIEKIDLKNRKNSDLNGPCKDVEKNKIFGYTKNSVPCCFEKDPKLYVSADQVIKENPYLITTNKPLEAKRKGILPPILNNLLNEKIEHDKKNEKGNGNGNGGAMIRWGVEQNKFSFLNCIVEALGDKIGENTTTFGLRKYIIKYLIDHKDVFVKINNGTIYLKYGKLENYIDAINDYNIQWIELVDLIKRSLGCNIIIIDIPFAKTKTTEREDYDKMKMLCLPVKHDLNLPFILLLKRQNSFELVAKDTQVSWLSGKLQLKKNNKSIVTFLFNYNSSQTSKTNFVNFFIEYYNASCIRENNFPENYEYDELYDISDLLKIIKDTSHDIYFQLINEFNKTIMIVTKRGLIIPVKENIIIDNVPKVNLLEFVNKNKAVDIDKLTILINEFNNLQNTSKKLSIRGIIKEKSIKNDMSELTKNLEKLSTK